VRLDDPELRLRRGETQYKAPAQGCKGFFAPSGAVEAAARVRLRGIAVLRDILPTSGGAPGVIEVFARSS